MVNSFRDAFERARRKQLSESTGNAEKEQSASKPILNPKLVTPVSQNPLEKMLESRNNPALHEVEKQQLNKNSGNSLSPLNRRLEKRNEEPLRSAVSKVSSSPVSPSPVTRLPQAVKTERTALPVQLPDVSVTVSDHATCAISLSESKTNPLLSKFEITGHATQIHIGKTQDAREVTLGLDFGTSCVKVVIGDAALDKAFAVPFCDANGIAKYLLPSRLSQTKRVFSLESGTHTYRDLKLSLLSSPEDSILQQRVVAFLTLIIRRARGWLLTEKASVYKKTAIVWRLAVGLPSAQHHQSALSQLFKRLSLAAWAVSITPEVVTDTAIQTCLGNDTLANETVLDVEVTVVPEIAAQIYGFVASSSFDKQAANIYLMADVGSGTVDSSLFHVKQAKGGRWDFEFYTSVVEPNGVSNLHRHRVNWWTEELTKAGAPQALIQNLETSKLFTDQQLSTPETFEDYFKGVGVKFQNAAKTPDAQFFNNRILRQVQGKTFWRTWRDGHLPQSCLVKIPFFMCGGGMRMQYYQKLKTKLASIPNYSWLQAVHRLMAVPNDLVADGVVKEDYDRLSVAYGLSRLEVGKIVNALPKPMIDISPVEIWRENYVDKDQC